MTPRKKHRVKHKPKPVIEYPPVPTKKWVPPYERPKKHKKPAYVKPPEVTQKLAVSSLKKIWHNFNIYGDRALLVGTTSQFSLKFPHRSNGFQGPCNCVVAVAVSKLYDITKWSYKYLDKILELGDHLYLASSKFVPESCRKQLVLCEVYHTFYVDRIKVTMDLSGQRFNAMLYTEADEIPTLKDVINDFFATFDSGILQTQQKYFAIWTIGKGFYIFDPREHDMLGKPWKDVPGTGYCTLNRLTNTDTFVQVIQENVDSSQNSKVAIVPCKILRKVEINVAFPACLKDANLELKVDEVKDIKDVLNRKISEGEVQRISEMTDDGDDDDDEEEDEAGGAETVKEEAPDRGGEGDAEEAPKKQKKKEVKVPVEKAKAASVTYFRDVIPDQIRILRASTHQCDPKFTRYMGKQSLGNAVAAITMLRIYKAKYWTTNILDEVLKLGEVIYHDSMKAHSGDQTLKVGTIIDKISFLDVDYAPDIEEMTVVGKLNSLKDEILDLLPALTEFFSDNDACIICGPIPLAVWVENKVFYMFDPNERDNKGMVIIKEMKIGSYIQVLQFDPGKACLTWCKNLKDLVELYMSNVPKARRREHFVLNKIQVKDYKKLPEAWYNFQCIADEKWILKGSFSQNDRRYDRETRNTQCTAMATMAIAMMTMKPVKEWTTDYLDKTLDIGDIFYEACCTTLKNKGAFVSRLLMIDELLTKFKLEDCDLEFDIDECLVNGNISLPDDHDFPNLKIGFWTFFENSNAGVVTCRNISVAIWKQDEFFYYFDSHSRDDQGISKVYGTSCVIRVKTVEELANALLQNLGASTNSQYNISRVDVKVLDAKDGIPQPPLNEFTKVTDTKAILRSAFSEMSPQFKINRGKQTIPNNMVALGMTKVYPTDIWNVDIMNEVLLIGDQLYVESMSAKLENEDKIVEVATVTAPPVPEPEPEPLQEEPKKDAKAKRGKKKEEVASATALPPPPPPPEPVVESPKIIEDEDSDAITSNNVVREFKIGINKFAVELDDVQEGTYENLEETLAAKYVPEEGALEDENDNKETLLESELLTLVMWKFDGLYYLFDPKPRDPSGQVFGKDEWSLEPPPEPEPEPEPEEEEDPEKKSDTETEHSIEGEPGAIADKKSVEKVPSGTSLSKDAEAGAAENENQVDVTNAEEVNLEGREGEDGGEGEEEAEGEGDEGVEVPPIMEKHDRAYWREQEKAGKACVVRFIGPELMIKHVVENTPPTKGETPFRLTSIKISNQPETKNMNEPETKTTEDAEGAQKMGGDQSQLKSGDWHDFKEIEYGRWILRGTMNLTNNMFPALNRGKQQVANCFTALSFASFYTLRKFTTSTIDLILMYGDRLHSFTENARRKELKSYKELELSDAEIDQILYNEPCGPRETVKHFCIGVDKTQLEVVYDVVVGEINAKDVEGEYDVERGLVAFFTDMKFGILCAKDLIVAIWRIGLTYYMFDPHSRGPSGLDRINGVACLTRYLDIGQMAFVFLNNLSNDGHNRFFIHSVKVNKEKCPREEVHPKKVKIPVTAPITGFAPVVPGKTVVRGNLSQEHQMFGRQPNAQSAAMTFVALAMTLVHKCMYWTKPIIDEIILIGDGLYANALELLGYDFNPWEQTLKLDMIPTDFKIGLVKANCELRPYDQTGIVDIKGSEILNLRQGIEKFFEENTHGVIETEPLVLAIWEENEPTRTIYMFDPSSRGPNGMPVHDGSACVLTFDSAKLVADHFMSLIPYRTNVEFVIRPVEVVVGKMKTQKKKSDTCDIKPAGISPGARRRAKEAELRARKEKEAQRLAKLGRKEFYVLPGGDVAILRGNRSIMHKHYSANSRGNQDIPVCLTAYVMERLLPFSKWTSNVIDMVLDVGDQLYKDSYIMHNPKERKLGFSSVIRDIIIKDVMVNIAIGKPVLINQFSVPYLNKALEMFFRQKNYCMICDNLNCLALFFKEDIYYLFDPHEMDMTGKRSVGGEAVLMKYNNLLTLSESIVENYKSDNIDASVFTIVMVAIKRIQKLPKKV